MSDSTGPDRFSGLLTPTSRAVAGLVLAGSALLGQNALTIGLQLIFASGPEAGDPAVYGVLLGFSVAVPAVLALFLVWGSARGPGSTWQAHLSRAAALVSVLVLVGAALMVLGGLLQF